MATDTIAEVAQATSWGSKDEARSGAPRSASPRSVSSVLSSSAHPRSPRDSEMCEGSFEEQERKLHMLLAEMHETIFIEDFGSTNSSGALSAEKGQEEVLVVKNLDTGRSCSLRRGRGASDSSQNGGSLDWVDPKWVDPAGLSSSRSAPWDGWWQELRQNNEELWKAAARGSTEILCDLLTPGLPMPEDWSSAPGDYSMIEPHSSTPPSSSSVAVAHISPSSSTVVRAVSPGGLSSSSVVRAVSPGGFPKVNIDARSLHGRTALHIAASNGQAECVEILLKSHADIDAQTDAGLTALHLACERGSVAVVNGLIAARCDMVAQTKQGELALHLAAAKGHTAVLSVLLEHCGDDHLGVRNSYGQRPAEVCQDIETNAFLCDRSPSASSSCPRGESRQDSYAGRTPFHQGSVLLRNSRADVVHRLLQRTGYEPKEPAVSSTAAGASTDGARRGNRKCFSKLRSADHIEAVGPDSFSLKSVLGKGSFGEVYQVVHRKSGEVYAMKVLRKNKIFGRNLVRYAMTERNLLSYIKHPFIVNLHYAFQTPTCLVLVLHYCSGGNLSQLIVSEGRLQEPGAKLYLAEAFLAIEHLHERKVIYRDLKPENVVLDDQRHSMLTDFGLSKEGVEGLQGTKSFCGSVAYLAPEILARKGHGAPVDLYGLGVLLYEMLAGRPPHYSRDRETLFRNIVSATLIVPSSASSRAASLIHALMRRDPAQRLGARQTSDVRVHPFFFGLDFDAVLRREVEVPPLRRPRRDANAASGSTGGAKVSSPFEGKLEAHVRRSWSSTAQELTGWEFSTCSPGEDASTASPRRSQPCATQERISEASGAQRGRGGRGGTVDAWLSPAFF